MDLRARAEQLADMIGGQIRHARFSHEWTKQLLEAALLAVQQEERSRCTMIAKHAVFDGIIIPAYLKGFALAKNQIAAQISMPESSEMLSRLEPYCYGGCGTRYVDFPYDVHLPTPLWNRITVGAPFDDTQTNIEREGRGGVLCPRCIVKRLVRELEAVQQERQQEIERIISIIKSHDGCNAYDCGNCVGSIVATITEGQ